MGVFILRIIRALGWRVVWRVVEIIRARGFERRHRWFLSRQFRQSARVRLRVCFVGSSLFFVFVRMHYETLNNNRVELSRPKKHQSKTRLSRLSRRRRRRRREAAHSRVKSRATAANLFCAVVFVFYSFVEFRVLDLSCDLCIRAHTSSCVWGDSIL